MAREAINRLLRWIDEHRNFVLTSIRLNYTLVGLNYTSRWREVAISILEFGYCNAIKKLVGPFGPILMEEGSVGAELLLARSRRGRSEVCGVAGCRGYVHGGDSRGV